MIPDGASISNVVLRVWLNRPERRNAVNATMLREIGDFFLSLETDFETRVVVLGGGDSALDWTLDLLPAVKSLTLVHRRDKFRATPHTVQAMETAVAEGRMNFVMGVLERLDGVNGELSAVTVKSETGSTTIAADRVLAFFGLNIELEKSRL